LIKYCIGDFTFIACATLPVKFAHGGGGVLAASGSILDDLLIIKPALAFPQKVSSNLCCSYCRSSRLYK
jgi:hypothetical protein